MCQLCSPGTFTNQTKETVCRNCPGGTFQDEEGKTACKRCPLGHSCPVGSTAAVPCGTDPLARDGSLGGYYADQMEQTECKGCEGGRYCALGSFKGLMCGRGNYCPPLSSGMTECPAGQYGATAGLDSEICSGSCDPGHYCELGSTSAQSTPCPAGSYNGSYGLKTLDECAECPAGTGCPSGSSEATPCSPGTVQPAARQGACVKCVAGKYQANRGQQNCTVCKAGSFCAEGATAQSSCAPGFYSSGEGESDNTTACKICPAGSACPTGASEPGKCQPGSVQDQTGQPECDKCEAGKFQDSQGKLVCKVCTLGGYCLKGSSAPTPCKAGRFGNVTGLTNLHECEYCTPGSSCPLGAEAPTPCTPGSVAPRARYDRVLAKAAGSSHDDLKSCEPCVPGTYQDVEGKEECKPCRQGGFCLAGAAVPTLCPAGFFGDGGTIGDTDQLPYCTQAMFSATLCLVDGGQILPLDNVTGCRPCSAGTSCPAGSVEETPCAAGTYADQTADTVADRHVCTKCAAGTYQNDQKSTECKPCETGGYCTYGAAAVRPCVQGTYNSLKGMKNRIG